MRGRFFESVLTFTLAFVVTALVTLAWSALVEGRATIEWNTAVLMAVVFGIVVPISHGMHERRVPER